MYEPQTRRIQQALVAMGGVGDFAASFQISAMGLAVEVDGVGSCRFPLRAEHIHELLTEAEPSPFGYRDQTLHDERVRSAREVQAAAVHLDPETWSTRLQRGIDHIVRALGFPEPDDVTTALQKLVLYDEGGFFAPHRDTERDPTMWGTVVVVLPSAHRGGELVVEHAGASKTFDTAADSAARRLSFVGFYADCLHEIRRVQQGCRAALIYSLHTRSSAARPTPGHQLVELRQSIASLFTGGEAWLIVLLDHSYTQQRFEWSALKNLDRTRVDALRHIGSDDDYACFLAFANVEESFHYDDEDGPPASRASFGSRRGAIVQLTGWIDEANRSCVGTDDYAEDPCIVSTVPSMERRPYEIRGEPWTGNEGGTAEQWYHQAAVVVVPRGGDLYDDVATPLPTKPPKSSKRTVRRRKKRE